MVSVVLRSNRDGTYLRQLSAKTSKINLFPSLNCFCLCKQGPLYSMFSARIQVRLPFMITLMWNPDSKSIFHNHGQCKLLNSFGSDDEMKWFLVCPILLGKSLKIDCKFEQQQNRIQQNRLLTQRCLLGPVNVYCLQASKICIWGCTPSFWGQSLAWVRSNSNRISRFSGFALLSLGLGTSAFKDWFCLQLLGRDGFPLWTVLLSSDCCLLLSHLLSNGLLCKHSQPMLL